MKHNPITKLVVAIVTGAAIFAFCYILQGAVFGNEISVDVGPYIFTSSTTPPAQETRGFVAPAKLVISSVGVNAKVQKVGLTATHAMGIPTNFTDVGWYKYGPVPGETGSAAIDGHVDNGLGLRGVFKNLKDVKIGDEVLVIDENNSRIHFKVTDIKTYPYNDAPSEEIFGPTDKTLLRLITCGGKWVKSAKTYDTRLVVTAEYVPQSSLSQLFQSQTL